MTHLALFADTPIARRRDPVTSHESAREITRSGRRARQQHAVLTLVRQHPGHTSHELSRYGIDRYTLARRLPELRAAGLVVSGEVRECTVTGKRALTWRAA